MDNSYKYKPEVKAAHAFLEISRDFTTPAELFREAIANSLDAYAQRIWLRASVQKRKGVEVVVIDAADDGQGMSLESIRALLNLSDSRKQKEPPPGRRARRMSGYKGHGAKIFFNSDELEVLSYDGGSPVRCRVLAARGELSEGALPEAEVQEISLEELRRQREEWNLSELETGRGTAIRVVGYHHNSKSGLEHGLLRDYIKWFTRWGSWEPKLCAVTEVKREEVEDLKACRLYVRGLGKEVTPDQDEEVPFGHVFPDQDCTDIRKLRAKDEGDPLRFYVRTWAFADVPLLRNPDKRIDFLFALEGDGARRDYNSMLRRQGKPRRAGDYLSEERYGLWLGRDFVPIQRFNSWVAEKSEYTRMHAFVNAQDLALTANRGSVENTELELIEDIRESVQKVFQERIQTHGDYERFEDELLAVERHRHAKKEGEDYKRRLKKLESKEVAFIDSMAFYSPTSETDLIALVAGIQARLLNVLPFLIREYDSHFGFDGLAARNKSLAINESQHLFVEFKLDLRKEFNHSFERLDAIICWRASVKDGEEVVDLSGNRGTYKITAKLDGTKARFVVVPNSGRNVEVIVFRDLMRERGYEFKPPGE